MYDNKKTMKYFLTINTPVGRCQIAADNWNVIADLIDPSNLMYNSNNDVQNAAKRAQKAYHKSYRSSRNGNKRSRAVQEGVEIEVISYYIMGWTGKEALDRIENKKGIKLSKSAVGRYWTRLKRIGVIPLQRLEVEDSGVIDDNDSL
ncbi:MAG: hypothetical protein WC770_09995 [Phycisphaerae bacterium]|jgi:hypothetical protein